MGKAADDANVVTNKLAELEWRSDSTLATPADRASRRFWRSSQIEEHMCKQINHGLFYNNLPFFRFAKREKSKKSSKSKKILKNKAHPPIKYRNSIPPTAFTARRVSPLRGIPKKWSYSIGRRISQISGSGCSAMAIASSIILLYRWAANSMSSLILEAVHVLCIVRPRIAGIRARWSRRFCWWAYQPTFFDSLYLQNERAQKYSNKK